MEWILLRSLMTVVLLVVFLGIVAWAWSGKQRDRFDSAARIPLDDEEPGPESTARDGGSGL